MDACLVTEADFSLRRMDIYIHLVGIDFSEQECHRPLAPGKRLRVGSPESIVEHRAFHRPAVQKRELHSARAAVHARLADEPADGNHSIQARMRTLATLGHPYSAKDIDEASAALAGRTELDALIAYLQSLGRAGAGVTPP